MSNYSRDYSDEYVTVLILSSKLFYERRRIERSFEDDTLLKEERSMLVNRHAKVTALIQQLESGKFILSRKGHIALVKAYLEELGIP